VVVDGSVGLVGVGPVPPELSLSVLPEISKLTRRIALTSVMPPFELPHRDARAAGLDPAFDIVTRCPATDHAASLARAPATRAPSRC
jgi:hypothetical protein